MARVILPLGLVAVAMIACRESDGPTSPIAAERSAPADAAYLPGGIPGSIHVKALKRLSPLTQRYDVVRTIGAAGGVISIPAAGFTLTFPAGALTSNTIVTMFVKPGNEVAFQVVPHMVFNKPVTVTVDLSMTEAFRNRVLGPSLLGAYFDGDLETTFTDVSRGVAKVLELRTAITDRDVKTMTFTVDHFSGYLASSGRAASSAAEGDQ